MSLDASIPLQIRPTQQSQDPMEMYGRMQSLKNMQAQAAERRQMAPLIMQEHQARTKIANLQAQDMDRMVREEKAIAQLTGEVYGRPDVEASAATVQPATSLQSGGTPTPVAPSPAEVPPPEAAATKPLSAMQAPAAAAPAAPRETKDQEFARKMAAAGLGQHVPRIIQNRAIAQETQIKLQDMERDQRDQQVWEEVGPLGGGDPKKTLALAAKRGMSQKAQAAIAKSMQDAVNARIKERELLSDVEKKEMEAKDARMDRSADRLAGFLKRDDEGMKANWKNFVEQLFRDGISNDAEHAETLKLNGGEFPGRAAVQGYLNEHASHKWLKDEAAAQLAAAKEKQAEEDRKLRLGYEKERIDLARNRDKRESVTQRRENDQQLAYQAWRESKQNGGTTWDHVRNNVLNFYDKNHPIGQNRDGVLKAIDELEAKGIRTDVAEASLEDKKVRAAMLEALGITEDGKPAGDGGRGSPKVTPQAEPKATALPDGGGKALDKETAMKFYTAAGNDPAKARDLAAKHNWKP